MDSADLHEQISVPLEARNFRKVRDIFVNLRPAEVAELLPLYPDEEQALVFRILPREFATEVFEYLEPDAQQNLLRPLGTERFAVLLNSMAPDDRTALLEALPPAAARRLVSLLTKEERDLALSLLGYPEHSVGRLMTPNYITVKEQWTVADVFTHIREHGTKSDHFQVIFVVRDDGTLIDDIRIRDLLLAAPDQSLHDIMNYKFLSLHATDDQEPAVEIFKKYDRAVLPVVDENNHLLGVVTVDDVLDVAEEEATEDILKLGGSEALSEPYLKAPIGELIRKRARWLVILFIGEMFTATAMGLYESEIEKAVVLALFIPLIISSGGNAGSQAATLVIRAMSIGEITLRDWLRVFKREILSGIALGVSLGAIGFLRVTIWSQFADLYGPHWLLVAVAVMLSLIGVVLWGALAGAMLPFVLKRLGADPAASSAPFVATVVDVTGLVLYFTIASFILGGVLL